MHHPAKFSMTGNRAQSPRFCVPDADDIEEELAELRLDIALEERDCAELRGTIGAEELSPETRQQAPQKWSILVTPRTFRKFHTIEEPFKEFPLSSTVLRSNHVYTPKVFQKTAWPVLLQNSDTLLLAPKKAGKFMSLLPIIANHALHSRVIIATSRKRCIEYYKALINIPLISIVVSETAIWEKCKANIVACPFAAFPKVAEREESVVCVVDGLDQLAEQFSTPLLRDILQVLTEKSSRVLATARTVSGTTRDLSSLIGFPVVVSAEKCDPAEENRLPETRVEMCDRDRRYSVLKRCLKEIDTSTDVVLVLTKNRKKANLLENALGDDDIDAQSLHARDYADGDVAKELLKSRTPGVYIIIPGDFSWLQEIDRVDMLIDLECVRSLSALSMRENRVIGSGIFVTFVSANDLQIASWLVPLFRQRKKPIRTELLYMFALYCSLTR